VVEAQEAVVHAVEAKLGADVAHGHAGQGAVCVGAAQLGEGEGARKGGGALVCACAFSSLAPFVGLRATRPSLPLRTQARGTRTPSSRAARCSRTGRRPYRAPPLPPPSKTPPAR
jgi:hypothetical protein